MGANDVVVGASFAGKLTAAVPLARGVKAWIAHKAGVGKDQAGISGLPFAQQFGIPAAAIATRLPVRWSLSAPRQRLINDKNRK